MSLTNAGRSGLDHYFAELSDRVEVLARGLERDVFEEVQAFFLKAFGRTCSKFVLFRLYGPELTVFRSKDFYDSWMLAIWKRSSSCSVNNVVEQNSYKSGTGIRKYH